MDAIALGLLNLGVSESPIADQHVLAELAAQHGYRLTHVLSIDEQTYMPTTLVLHSAETVRATAILAPDLAHFGTIVKALALACTLVVPQAVIPRVAGWTPHR